MRSGAVEVHQHGSAVPFVSSTSQNMSSPLRCWRRRACRGALCPQPFCEEMNVLRRGSDLANKCSSPASVFEHRCFLSPVHERASLGFLSSSFEALVSPVSLASTQPKTEFVVIIINCKLQLTLISPALFFLVARFLQPKNIRMLDIVYAGAQDFTF